MKIHDLKIDSKFYERVRRRVKKAEIRYNDRDFQVGDSIRLHKYENNKWTGCTIYGEITDILTHEEFAGLAKGYVMLSFKLNKIQPDI